MRLVLLVSFFIALGATASAEEPTSDASPSTLDARRLTFDVLPSTLDATASAAADFDPFLIPVQNPEADFEAERLKTRRTYLKVHQVAALTSLGLLIGQVALGQVLLNKKREGDLEGYDDLRDYHRWLGITTFSVYSVAAGAAFFAPKIDREGAYDAITIHKSLAIIHMTGMIVTPLRSYYQVSQSEKIKTVEDADRVRRLNTIHQATGYTTAAALAGAMLVITIQ